MNQPFTRLFSGAGEGGGEEKGKKNDWLCTVLINMTKLHVESESVGMSGAHCKHTSVFPNS